MRLNSNLRSDFVPASNIDPGKAKATDAAPAGERRGVAQSLTRRVLAFNQKIEQATFRKTAENASPHKDDANIAATYVLTGNIGGSTSGAGILGGISQKYTDKPVLMSLAYFMRQQSPTSGLPALLEPGHDTQATMAAYRDAVGPQSAQAQSVGAAVRRFQEAMPTPTGRLDGSAPPPAYAETPPPPLRRQDSTW